jgi:hypothetical protein
VHNVAKDTAYSLPSCSHSVTFTASQHAKKLIKRSGGLRVYGLRTQSVSRLRKLERYTKKVQGMADPKN